MADREQDRDRDPAGRARQARPRDALGRPLPYDSVGVEPVQERFRTAEQAVTEARSLVDQGRFFAAHEVLEGRWKDGPQAERDLWQGLAQVCVGLTHAARGNVVGARRLVERGCGRLTQYVAIGGPTYGIDLAAVCRCARTRLCGMTTTPAAETPDVASSTLVLLRHGQSDWNAKGLFTGWVDVALTELGEQEARRGGELLRSAGVLPDVVHTSLQRRAISTANLALDVADRHWIPTRRNWRLNERHYGALQGKDKKETLQEYGEEQFMLWRRSYDTPPPPLADDSEYSQAHDVRYRDLGPAAPRTECLADVLERFLPYWDNAIVPDLRNGKVVLVAAHGNSLRALVKHLDGLDADTVAGLNIPTGMPLVYRLDAQLTPLVAGGEYLDPQAAAEAAAAVANQGR